MSDSELSEASHSPVPPDNELERSLRRATQKASKTGGEFTVNTIRADSEQDLGLTTGFYKNHPDWKDRSKGIINDQLSKSESQSSPPSKSESKSKVGARTGKRASVEKEPVPRKRQKTSKNSNAPEEIPSPPGAADSDFEEPMKTKQPHPKPTTSAKKPPAKKSKVANPNSEEQGDKFEPREDIHAAVVADDDSGSELSVLLDEEPRGGSQSKAKKPVTSRPKQSKPTKPRENDDDPDQAEIKRLQGWLVKCGIRKLWGKELKPYQTPNAKMKHLRDMLTEIGMTGRYSNEKAAQIKEARELAADIEAVKEGNERWGADEGVGGDGKGADQPRRRLVRGAQNYAFLSSDGEETD